MQAQNSQAQNSTPTATVYNLRWSVPSEKNPRVAYDVTAPFSTSLLRCSCPAYQYGHGAACKHIKRVVAGQAGKPVVRATVPCRRPREDVGEWNLPRED